MTTRPVPKRHWRSYGTEPLPIGREALDETFRATSGGSCWAAAGQGSE
jgi:hypothetical protein